MLNLLGDFIGELRAAGIPVSMSEHVDAARAVEVIDLADRVAAARDARRDARQGRRPPAGLQHRLRRLLLRRARGRAPKSCWAKSCQTASSARGAAGDRPGPARGEGGGGAMSAEELAELLFRALRDGDRAALRAGRARR